MTRDTLDAIAKLYLLLSIVSAVWVVVDIFACARRQRMKIMEIVWPLTMLSLGPMGLLFYYWFGRARRDNDRESRDKPMWQATFSGTSHCGAGCA